MSLDLVNSALLLRETTLTNLPYTDSATNIQVTDSGEFEENFTAGRHFHLVIWDKNAGGSPTSADDANKLEIVKATAEPSANNITIERAQEGTDAIEFSAGGDWQVSLMLTPETLKSLVSKLGGTMTGLLRATAGINFLASGGDTFQNYEMGVWNPSTFSGSQIGCSSTSFDSNLQYVRIGDMMFVQIKGTTTISSAGITCALGVESLPEPMYDNNAFPFGSILIDLVNASPDIWTFSNNTQFGWTWLSRTAVTTGFHGWACYRVAP